MSISEEELQKYEFDMSQNGWLISDYAVELIQEVRELRGAMFAQDERERKAAERLGMIHTCDWPDDVADRVLATERFMDTWKKQAGMRGDIISEVQDSLVAAEHREKVAMKALANAIAAWNGEDFPPNMSTSPLEPWLEQAGKELQP